MENALLIVDDDPDVISALQKVLTEEAHTLHFATSGIQGLDLLRRHRVKVVISDEKMPGMSGADFLSIVKERYPETIRILLTGYASIEAAMKAVNDGEIYRFFTKPWRSVELRLATRSAFEKYNLEAENRSLLKTLKRQSADLKALERIYPGISSLERDESGCLVIPEVSSRELSDIAENC